MTGAADAVHSAEPSFPTRRSLLLGFVTLAVLGAGLFGWGAFTSISGAAIAVGRVEVNIREQAVERIDGGTVGEVLVREGDRVEADALLIRLDDSELRSDAALLEAEAAELAARRNRLEAEFRDADTIAWDPELAARAAGDPLVAEVLEGQARLFAARRESRAGRTAQLEERIGQTRKQIAGLQAQGDATARQREFVARELDARRTLFQRKLAGLPALLELEREAARLDGQAGDIAARIAGARGRIAELEVRMLQIGTLRVEEAEAEARETQARENQVRERLAMVRRKLGRMEIRAPVAGEVFEMTVFTEGEVVPPGRPILKIVPEDTGLVVRAQLDPIYVDQVWPGQEAVLRFTAFTARTTPEFAARVQRVSADARHDARTGLDWYEVELAVGRAIRREAGAPIERWIEAARETVAGWLPGSPERRVPDRESAPKGPRAVSSGEEGGEARDRQAGPGPAGGAESTPPALAGAPSPSPELALMPGMPVEVYLRTGERSPLSYLAKPLTDYFSRSLREE